jgi:hypothetical protein
MSADLWKESQYRLQVWESTPVFWPARQIRGPLLPAPGDRMLCWYVRTGGETPGLCGWGIVLSFDEESNEIAWRPVYPSDLLKMRPLFDESISARIDEVRGKFAQGTMWMIERSDADWLMEKIASAAK